MKVTPTYTRLKKEYLSKHTICQCKMSGCTLKATDVHHKRGRLYLEDISTFMAVCRSCHNWIHSHTAEAEELGFIESRLT